MTGGNEEMKKSFIHKFLSMRMNSGDEGKLRKNSYDPTEVASGIRVLDSMAMSHDMQSLRVFAATWNVGGKPPSSDLDLDNFLQVHCQSDIYILGFQEIVPLNAGNVLVIEDNGTAAKWLSLISQSLNKSCNINYSPIKRTNTNSCSFERNCSGSGSLFLQRTSLKTANKAFRSESRRRLKSCNCNVVEPERKIYGKDSCFACPKSKSNACDYASSSEEDDNLYKSGVSADVSTATPPRKNQHLRYSLIKSKQMVGIFVTIWVKNELVPYIGHLRTSCISRGILGCLGNKGCIAVSMTFKQTSFCFVASHLAAGEKEGDELRRNLDVIEILKSTQFPKICKIQNTRVPDKILGHDRVIWLGDLNYRIALSYHETKKLLEQDKWDVLLNKDQLKIERKAGRVFAGWKEGKIGFPPTYKYSYNSDLYAGDTIQSKSKRRTPAWCDRILWHGDGIHQKSYARWDSRFSDHRPVCATFLIFLHHLRY
ncbi:putative endonuclease/exonuclease/phosphatase [Helianthus annuus]|uniref:Endonuclease/exonuclease/phosphatase n=2 Tax=Helianthus annuus TaxID=4232 RepID=A0A251S9H4_HELAN|nr:type I inositol polyphosphate 5-phosphatase 10 isoform X2 [Helianthus annuus]KAF5765421.1 putative endonuclease/exonuclease/phosphatase [Helianthus annuus]KAJ0451960.1 putative endonuclease/exonuclease/phosphatase [Helianthus annuus]KAJ0456686.1 putative endonuclease/exonuclease/phosphatase [Helianthus annuus]KAJ0473842.1 putative endonuclease/exonuclease/phosphatase [Helianthus annuus]KAJ0649418.1 putative endonuclease/exonuclease/phosphatase [Helianthus annuus]